LHNRSAVRGNESSKTSTIGALPLEGVNEVFKTLKGQRVLFLKRFSKRASILATAQRRHSGWKKRSNSVLDKIFFFYRFYFNFSFFIYKVFTYMELFLFSVLLSTQLVKYAFLIKILCFNRLVFINQSNKKLPLDLVALYDTVTVYNKLYFYLNFQQNQQYFFSEKLTRVLNLYWRQYLSFRSTKM
jgi:hypothetical protein